MAPTSIFYEVEDIQSKLPCITSAKNLKSFSNNEGIDVIDLSAMFTIYFSMTGLIKEERRSFVVQIVCDVNSMTPG